MSESTFHTTQLRGWLDRMQAGDPAARDELVRATQLRLEHLTRLRHVEQLRALPLEKLRKRLRRRAA